MVDVQVVYGGTVIRRRATGSAPHGAHVGAVLLARAARSGLISLDATGGLEFERMAHFRHAQGIRRFHPTLPHTKRARAGFPAPTAQPSQWRAGSGEVEAVCRPLD